MTPIPAQAHSAYEYWYVQENLGEECHIFEELVGRGVEALFKAVNEVESGSAKEIAGRAGHTITTQWI